MELSHHTVKIPFAINCISNNITSTYSLYMYLTCSCWSHFSMCGSLSTASSYHKARWSTSMSRKRYCGVWFAQCTRRSESCGRTTRGCFTMTTPPSTPHWVSDNSWSRRTSLCWSNFPTRSTWLHVIFSSCPSSRASPREPVLKLCTTAKILWRQSYGESRKNSSREDYVLWITAKHSFVITSTNKPKPASITHALKPAAMATTLEMNICVVKRQNGQQGKDKLKSKIQLLKKDYRKAFLSTDPK